MSQHFDAIFENGVLKPLEPLHLPEQSRVKVTVEDATASDPRKSPAVPTDTAPLAADAMGYPVGYFKATAGSFADEPLERPTDLPQESRESW